MATAIGDLVVNLTANSRRLTSGLSRARRSVAAFAGFARSAFAAIAPIGGLFLFAGAIKSGEEFNQKMRQSLAIMGDVSDMMQERMKRAAFDVARVTKFSASETAKAYFFLASAGMDANQSIAALPAVAQFAQAGMFDLSVATSLSTDALAAFRLKSKDPEKNLRNLRRVMDVLVKANTLADATTEEFAVALTRVGGQARIAGVSLEETVAVLAAFAEQGFKGAAGGEKLMILMRDLPRAVAKNQDAWTRLIGPIEDVDGTLRPMSEIIAAITGRLSTMGVVERAATFEILGLTRGARDAAAILSGFQGEIKGWEEALLAAGGTTREVADKQLTPLQKGLARLGAGATEAGAAFMNAFGPAIGGVLGDIGDMLPPLVFAFKNFGTSGKIAILEIVAAGLRKFPELQKPVEDFAVFFIGQLAGIEAFFKTFIGTLKGGLEELANLIDAFDETKTSSFLNPFVSAPIDDFNRKLGAQKDVKAPDAFADFAAARAKAETAARKKLKAAGGIAPFIDSEIARLQKELDRRADVFAGANAIAKNEKEEEVTKPSRERDPAKDKLSEGKRELFEGKVKGSKSAFDAILKAQLGGKVSMQQKALKAAEKAAKAAEETAASTQESAQALARLDRKSDSGVLTFGAFA